MRRFNLFKALLITTTFALLAGCSLFQADVKTDMTNLKELQNLSGDKSIFTTENQVTIIRHDELRDVGMSVGAQSGLAWRAKQVNEVLSTKTRKLDRIYNFQALMLKDNVLPPVLAQGKTTMNASEPNSIRVSDRTYVIISQARFASAPPNWRDYLWMNFIMPEIPDHTLLPENIDERNIWQDFVTRGWEEGIKQADAIFADSLARLKRDYSGMILYRSLLAQKMVTPPYVAISELGVTGGKDEMRINDKALRIAALPELESDSSKWNPAFGIVKFPKDGLAKFPTQEETQAEPEKQAAGKQQAKPRTKKSAKQSLKAPMKRQTAPQKTAMKKHWPKPDYKYYPK